MNTLSRSRPKHSGLMYLKHAMMSPVHLMVIAVAVLIGLASFSIIPPLVMFGATELSLLAVMPRLPSFRRYVDGVIEEKQRALAAKERAGLLSKMSCGHREELESLEKMVDHVRRYVGSRRAEAPPAGDDCFGLSSLLATYVEIAIAHEASKEHLDRVSRKSLEKDISALSASRPLASASVSAIIEKRLTLLRKRLEHWDVTRDELEAMGQKLAMIGDGIRLIHEHFTVAMNARLGDDDVEEAIAGIENGEAMISDFSALPSASQSVDPDVLELGRKRVGRRAGGHVDGHDAGEAAQPLSLWFVAGVRPIA